MLIWPRHDSLQVREYHSMNRKQTRTANSIQEKTESVADRRGAGAANFVRREVGRAIEHHRNGDFPGAAAIYVDFSKPSEKRPRSAVFR